MRRRTASGLLLIVSVLAVLSQIRLLPQDQGVLLELAGQPHDVAGRLLGFWQHNTQACSSVDRLAPGTPAWQEAQQVLAAYSPPASAAAWPVQLLAQRLAQGSGDAQWLLAEVRWDGPAAATAPTAAPPSTGAPPATAAPVTTAAPLDPAIVPLLRQNGQLQVVATGVWSGDTGPWYAPVFIRRVLAQRLPSLPSTLRQCLDPQLPPFNR